MNCQIEIPRREKEEVVSLTVGREFLLHCEGEWPELQTDRLEFRLDEADKDKLKLLKLTFVSKTQADLLVTSYRPGEHHLKMVQLVDADHSVVLGDLDLTVTSVINPQQPPSEPYGPMGPLSFQLPFWYDVALLLVVLAGALWGAWKWRDRRQRLRLLAEMRLHEYVQEPIFQFYQTVRKMPRTYGFFSGQDPQPGEMDSFLKQMDEAFKLYLARQLLVPTLKWSDRQILADIKKHHRDFAKVFQNDLRKSFAELSRARQHLVQLSVKDCQQFLDLLRRQVDKMDAYLKAQAQKASSGFFGKRNGDVRGQS